MKPFTREYADLKLVAVNPMDIFTFVAYNPNIKTPEDLVGKKVGVFGKTASPTPAAEALLRDAWGVYDQVKISYHNPMQMKDVLITGIVDAIFAISLTPLAEEGKYIAAPFTSTLLAARETHWLNVTPEDVQRIRERNVFKPVHVLVSKDSAGAGYPPEDIGLLGTTTGWLCWDSCTEEVVYELVKFIAENDEERSRRMHGQRTGAEYLAAWPELTEDRLHPGALRYYKEHNIKIGV